MSNHYSVVHIDHKPEILAEQWPNPRQLNSVYVVYRGECPDTPAVYTPPTVLDAEGNEVAAPIEQVVAEVAALMYANSPGPIVLERSEALTLLATPHWRIYAGQYSSKDELEVDVLSALGLDIDKRKSLTTLITEAQTLLKTVLAG